MTLPAPMPLQLGLAETSPANLARKRRGDASELLAAVHLMEQGFDVYRCVSSHAVFDLVAHRDAALYRVEVKSLSRPSLPSYVPTFAWPANDEWDLLVVVGDGVIFQFSAGTSKDETREEIARAFGIELVDPEAARATSVRGRIKAVALALFTETARPFSAQDIIESAERSGIDLPSNGRTSLLNRVRCELVQLADKGELERVASGRYEPVANHERGAA